MTFCPPCPPAWPPRYRGFLVYNTYVQELGQVGDYKVTEKLIAQMHQQGKAGGGPLLPLPPALATPYLRSFASCLPASTACACNSIHVPALPLRAARLFRGCLPTPQPPAASVALANRSRRSSAGFSDLTWQSCLLEADLNPTQW